MKWSLNYSSKQLNFICNPWVRYCPQWLFCLWATTLDSVEGALLSLFQVSACCLLMGIRSAKNYCPFTFRCVYTNCWWFWHCLKKQVIPLIGDDFLQEHTPIDDRNCWFSWRTLIDEKNIIIDVKVSIKDIVQRCRLAVLSYHFFFLCTFHFLMISYLKFLSLGSEQKKLLSLIVIEFIVCLFWGQ